MTANSIIESHPEINANGTVKVCLIEADYFSRLGISSLLKLTSDIEIIEDGLTKDETLEMVLNKRPHVVIIDVGADKEANIQTANKIINQKGSKVIMLLNAECDDELEACLEVGAHGYCTRSTTPARLYAAIRCVNDGDFWVDPCIAKKMLVSYLKQGNTNDTIQHLHKSICADHLGSNDLSSAHNGCGDCDRMQVQDVLSVRETQVLLLLVQGFTNRQIAGRLFITISTAKSHVHNIFEKLDVHDRTQATVKALKLGLVKL